MTFELDKIRQILTGLARQCEDLWLERGVFRETLIRSGLSAEQADELATRVKSDPQAREQAQQAFAPMLKLLEDQAREALIEDKLKKPLPTDKPN